MKLDWQRYKQWYQSTGFDWLLNEERPVEVLFTTPDHVVICQSNLYAAVPRRFWS